MHFDTTLNVAWLLLGLCALAGAAFAAVRRVPVRGMRQRWLHVVGVGLIVVALFPYISATDDVVRVAHFDSHQSHGQHKQQRNTDNLIRLYEAMDTPVIQPVASLSVERYFAPLTVLLFPTTLDRETPRQAGRSPPHDTGDSEQSSSSVLRTLAA